MIGINNGFRRSIPLLALITLLLSACGSSPSKSNEQPVPTITSQPALTSTPSPRTLTICLDQEPNTLYPFGNLNAAAQSVLAALDDGPIDTIGYTYQPVILQKLPSIANGDATISQITVNNGSEVVDANGNLTALNIGTSVRPSGCRSNGCAINYSGSTLQIDQMSVTFHLRPDLTWSDGTPLTADDSVYGYQVVSNDSSSPFKFLADHTQSYSANDMTTLHGREFPALLTQPTSLISSIPRRNMPGISLVPPVLLKWMLLLTFPWVGDHI